MSVRAVAAPRAPILLASSAVAVSKTGDTNETELASVSVPAMGANGGIQVRATWSFTSSANNKIPRIRFSGSSGTVFRGPTIASGASFQMLVTIRNRNSASSQIGSCAAAATNDLNASTALPTGSVDTSAATTVSFTAQLGLGTETLTLESYEVWLLPV